MEITFDREYFQKKVNSVKSITKRKTHLPVCRSVLVDFKTNTISATDLEVSAVTSLVTKSSEKGRVVIPAGLLSEILGNFKDQEVTLIDDDDGKMLRITQGNTEIGLALADPLDFPEIETLNGKEAFAISGKDLVRGLNKVLYAVSSDEQRFVLTGVLMHVKDGEFRVCGTDGFRIALFRKTIRDVSDTPQVVIPGRNVKILKDIIDDNDNIGIVMTDERVQFMTKTMTVILRTLSGAYPDYNGVLKTTTENIAFIRRVPFLDCLRRMSPMAGKNDPVRLTRTDVGFLVNIESDRGYAREFVACDFKTNAGLDFEFDLRFLLEAVEHNESDQLVMRYHETYGAIVIDTEEYQCGIMPLRTDLTPIERAGSTASREGVDG